jgi:hypothetical protein
MRMYFSSNGMESFFCPKLNTENNTIYMYTKNLKITTFFNMCVNILQKEKNDSYLIIKRIKKYNTDT